LPPIEVHFSPEGGCTETVVREIEAAQSSILIQAFSFTSVPIAKAVVEAYKRGVHVEVILDRSQKTEKYSMADYLHNSLVPLLIDSEHAIAHNKIMIIDGQVVITGSFNFTNQAEHSNAENLLVIRDKILADQYTVNWKLHAEHSQEYAGKVKQDREYDFQE
jgi:phosphatidylserine/phosphatidylglycerophosphate/cardiolipin synthase-like enzyme